LSRSTSVQENGTFGVKRRTSIKGRPAQDRERSGPGWELYIPVHEGADEVVIRKTGDDGFDGTDLGGLLHRRGVRSASAHTATNPYRLTKYY
jgi:nicotinamidase-related amidase